MTPETAPDLIRMLTDSRRELNEAAAGFTDAEAAATPQAGGWSALECVEHVTFVEERFLGRIAAALLTRRPPRTQRRWQRDLRPRRGSALPFRELLPC